jgi:hypothetical protein
MNGLLGEFFDPSYGTIKAGYVCQFYPSYGFYNIDSIVDNKIDSIFLNIYYTFQGDSLAPMELSVYPVIVPLDKDYYTNRDPSALCNMRQPLVRYGYTARNMNISDTLMVQSNYDHFLSIHMPVEFGQSFLEEARKPQPNAYSSIQKFTEFFPGTYLTTTFGTGSLLNVSSTEMRIYYRTNHIIAASDGSDSAVVRNRTAIFPVTKEVIQLNNIKSTNASLLQPNDEKVYLKSPAGVFTELVIPIRDIITGIGKKKFNSVKLSLEAYPRDEWEYALDFPGLGPLASSTSYKSQLLLIEPDSVKNFFEQQKVSDNITSFTTTFNASTYTYNFSNIANVVQNAIDKAPDKDLKLWLIPVMTTYSYQQDYSGSGYDIDYSTSHYLWPSGVTLKKGGDNLKVRVIASDLNIR